MGKLILGYWNIRALAEPIRYALEYCGEDYDEKLYTMGGAPDFDKSEWTSEKFSLGLDFPNLPYVIDGDLKITESLAILKYICRKHKIMPKTDKDITRADNLEGVLGSLRSSFYSQFFVPEEKYDEAKKSFKENTFPETIEKILKFIGENKWLVGNAITYLDFMFYTQLKQTLCMNSCCLESYPQLKKYVADFEALPGIHKYLSSGKFKEYPITNPFIRWGYKKET